MKLETELVPKTVWFKSFRELVGRKNWDIIRRKQYELAGHRCEKCTCHPTRLNCHEIWEYDDAKHIQYLRGFIALCDLCHHVKHLGYAGIGASEGWLDYEEVVKHFMEVNSCAEADFYRYRDLVFEKWEQRSKYEWEQDFGEYSVMVEQIKGGIG